MERAALIVTETELAALADAVPDSETELRALLARAAVQVAAAKHWEALHALLSSCFAALDAVRYDGGDLSVLEVPIPVLRPDQAEACRLWRDRASKLIDAAPSPDHSRRLSSLRSEVERLREALADGRDKTDYRPALARCEGELAETHRILDGMGCPAAPTVPARLLAWRATTDA